MVSFILAMNREDVVALKACVSVRLDGLLVGRTFDWMMVGLTNERTHGVDGMLVFLNPRICRDMHNLNIMSVLEHSILKNLFRGTSRRFKGISVARVMSQSIDRSVDRSLGGSIARLLGR